jgi:hypothetical protein
VHIASFFSQAFCGVLLIYGVPTRAFFSFLFSELNGIFFYHKGDKKYKTTEFLQKLEIKFGVSKENTDGEALFPILFLNIYANSDAFTAPATSTFYKK